MTHSHLVADELKTVGFVAQSNSGKVFVNLQNRKVSIMEVKTELDRIFEGINFNILSTQNGVLVSW